jgi:hypothetical protein
MPEGALVRSSWRYASSRALSDDLDRWMADEPVTAWREPFSRRARRWARRNRTAAMSAAVALVAGMVGLSAVLAVQTKAKAEPAASLTRETTADLALTRSQAAVQARYHLAAGVTGSRNDLAQAHSNIAVIQRTLGRAALARDGFDRAIAIREDLVKANPKVTHDFQRSENLTYPLDVDTT